MSKTRKSRDTAGQPALPQTGGSFIRLPDGTLRRQPHPKAASQAGREDRSNAPHGRAEASKKEK